MELLSRKATDKELGLAKSRLETVLGYWANQWNYRQLPELPEYVQDLYVLYTYSLWLEEQLAILREELKNGNDRAIDGKDGDTNNGSVAEQPDTDDKEGTVDRTPISEPAHVDNVPPPTDGTGQTDLGHDDKNLPHTLDL